MRAQRCFDHPQRRSSVGRRQNERLALRGACHALADANASGSIGPSFDRNPRLTKAYAVDVISNGRGAMPSFAGQMSPEQIDQIAEYIVQFSRK